MRRFTDTDRWDMGWYLRLNNDEARVLKYLEDKCDCAGFLKIDYELVSSRCGLESGAEVEAMVIGSLAKKVTTSESNLIWLHDFILEQDGTTTLTYSKLKDRGILKRLRVNEVTFPGVTRYLGGVGVPVNELEAHSNELVDHGNELEAHDNGIAMSLKLIRSKSKSKNNSSSLCLKNISTVIPVAAAEGVGAMIRKVWTPTWEILKEQGMGQFMGKEDWFNLCRSFPKADPCVVVKTLLTDIDRNKGNCPWIFKAAQKLFMNHEEVNVRIEGGLEIRGIAAAGPAPVGVTTIEDFKKQTS